jgi:cell shape-determining protein MreD
VPVHGLGLTAARRAPGYTRTVYLWIPTSALLFVTVASTVTTDDEVLGLAAVLGALFAVRVWRILGRS